MSAEARDRETHNEVDQTRDRKDEQRLVGFAGDDDLARAQQFDDADGVN